MNTNIIDKEISVSWKGDVSTITSPNFDDRDFQRSSFGNGSSLFSRLASQMTSPTQDEEHRRTSLLIIGSPTESSETEPSPIKASDSMIELEPQTKLSFADEATTPAKVSNNQRSLQTNDSRRERILALLSALESNDPASVMDTQADHALDNSKQSHLDLLDTARDTMTDNPNHRTINVSFDVDVSRETSSSPPSRPMNESMTSHQTSSSSKRDEWKEVVDPETGRNYYYNRMTRASKWKLPKGAVLVKSNKKSSKSQVSSVTNQQGRTVKSAIQTHDNLVDLLKYKGSSAYAQTRQQTIEPNETENEETKNEDVPTPEKAVVVESNNFKSPQDCGPSRSDNFFCMYCGLSCSIESLGAHLSQCSFEVDSSTRMKLEKIVIDTLSIKSARLTAADAAYSSYSESNEWDTTADEASISMQKDKSTPNKPYQHKRVDEYIEVEVKTCPFCRDEFCHGNQFSNHLLRCSERRRAKEKRRAKKVQHEVISCPRTLVETRRSTPGRKLPWE